MKTSTYVTYSDEVEKRPPDENELIASIAAAVGRISEEAHKRYKRGTRNQHAKSHGVLRGELTVYPDLEDHLRQGLFATPATYPVIARFSSADGEIRSDQVHGPRGMSIKVLGVDGPRALPEDDGVTQDFLLVNKPTIVFGDLRSYRDGLRIAAVRAKAPDLALRVVGVLARGVAGVLRTVHIPPPTPVEVFAGPNNHILGETFHTMGALRYGDYIAKLSVAPLSESVCAFTGRPVEGSRGDDALREMVTDFFGSNSAEYELRAQLCTDLATMPVEDASKRWPDKVSSDEPIASKHEPIAKITFPAQDTDSPARLAYADDKLLFNPWHALADHRPLGSINRVRIKAYEASTALRHKMNNTQPVEPRDIAELPD
ncbi:catalase family protein [Rhodococcus koreensis]